MDTTTTNVEKVRKYLQLRDEVTADKETLAEKTRQLEALEFELVKEFESNGVQRMNVDGRTLYLSPELFCNVLASNKPSVIAWARQNGLSDAVREDISTSTLKAWIKEQIGEFYDLDLLPPELTSLVKVHAGVGMRVLSK
jgi:hypothetical protein